MRRPALLLVGLLLLATTARADTATRSRPLRGLRAEVAALLMQGVGGGGLPIAVAVFPQSVGSSVTPAELSFLVELEVAVPAETGTRPLEVYAYAVDGAGEVVSHFAVTLPEWPADGEGVKIAGRLPLAPGDYSLRFLAWDPVARRYGLAVRQVAFDASSASPRIAEECDGWSVADDASVDPSQLSARPVLVSGETQRLSLGRVPPPDGWQVHLESVGKGPSAARVVEASVVEPHGLEFVVPDLPPGVYDLSVAVVSGEAWSSLPLESWLVSALPPADGGCRRSWRRVLRLARSGRFAATPQPAPQPAENEPARNKPAPSRPARRLAAGYRALLERLASAGDLASAARDLAALEAPVVEEDSTRTRLLFAAEFRAVRSLAKRDARCLIPLIALHAETYGLHYGAGRFALATHSRRLAAAIAESAAELMTAPEERALIAVSITGLADMVETRRASIAAQRLLERALSLDETQEAARLLLAVSYERKGRYLDARRQLEALVSANSAHHEARVRLAILLRRIGQREEAEHLLGALIAEQPSAWLLSLAYQTLAQLLIRDGRFSEAAVQLEQARGRLPEDQVLHLLRAYTLDRSGERQAVRELLAGLPPAEAAVTPRYRYSDEAAVALGLLHETLRQSVTVRLPVLALALDVERSGGPAG